MTCTHNARTVSSNASSRVPLNAAGRIKFHLIALHETKTKKEDVRQMKNENCVICGEKLSGKNVGGVGFVAHPSVVRLVVSH